MPQYQRLIILLLLANLCNYAIKAQTQADNWYFGNNAGIAFYSGNGYHVGYPIFGGQTTTLEGCASISDISGKLLFYTDGMSVWDQTHSLMPSGTGLLGNSGVTQSSLIVQNPSIPQIYYIITVSDHWNGSHVAWTEVDMNLNGGNGDVTANKNIILYSGATEKLCGIKHCNKKDVWIIIHEFNTNNFRSYLINSTGISSAPIISSSGSIHGGIIKNKVGQMKVSMDGKKIACAVNYDKFIELHDFDNTTGIVSNGFVLNNTPDNYYGVEFTKSAKKLYASCTTTGSLYQWDLCAGTNIDIKNSEFLVSDSIWNAGSLQLGPDGKIYRARINDTIVDFIEFPDIIGSGCGYIVGAVELWPSMTSTYSLPGFVVDYINPALKIWYEDLMPCQNKQFYFSAFHDTNCVGAFNNLISYYWDFGDTASGLNNYSILPNPTHNYSSPGLYYASLIVTFNCVIDTLTIPVSTGCGSGGGGGGGGIPNQNITASACQGTSALVTIPPATFGTGPHYVAWVPWTGVGFNVNAPPGATSATAVVIDANGNGLIYDVIISYLPNPSISAYGWSNCDGSSWININVAGGAPPLSLSSGIYPSSPGYFTITVSDANGCTASVSGFIPYPPSAPSANLSFTHASCYDSNDGTITVNVLSASPPVNISVNGISISGSTITGLGPGFYNIFINDGSPCTFSDFIQITAPPPISSVENISNPSCPGIANGEISLNVNGGTPPFSYSWSNGATGSLNNNLPAGNYYVTITDANGCDTTYSYILVDPLSMSSMTVSTPATCPGIADGTATVNPMGGIGPFTYSWSNGATTDVNTNLQPGVYYVTITDSAGCFTIDSVIVGELTAVVSSVLNYSDATCNGASDGTALVSATGGTAPYSFLWPNGNTGSFDTSLSANTYIVTVTDSNGCSSTISVLIDEPPPYTLSATNSNDVSCFGGNDGSATVQISAGVQPVNYLWSNGNSGANQSGLSANSYVVTATDAVGCSATTTITINEPNQLIVSVLTSNNISCFGANDGNITSTGIGGIAPYSYNWSNGLTGSIIDSLSPGSYTVVITDNNNCTSTALFTITEPDQLVSTISSSTDVICFGGNDGTATVTCTGGISPYNYSWSSGSSNSSATALQQGVYIVTITDANGCLSTASVQITEPPQLVSSTFSISETCGNSNGSATVTATGGVGVYSYLWTGGNTTSVITNLTAGNYTVTVTDGNGCTSNSSISVSNIPGATLNILSQQDVVCNSDCNGSVTISASAGTLPYNYSWTSIPGNNSPSATGLCAGNYDVSVIDSNGCVTTLNITINEPFPLFTSVSPDVFICVGDSATISATSTGGTPGYSYIWNPGNLNSNSILVAPLNSTSYIVNTTDANGCEAVSSSVTVNVVPLPVIEFKSDITEGCQPLCVSFTNLTPLTSICQWDFSGGTTMLGDNVINCFNEAGIYDVSIHVTDTFGCNNTLSFDDYITVYPKPEANFNVSPLYSNILEPDFYFTDISTSAIEWLWNFGDPQENSSMNQNTYFTYRDTGVFQVSLIITNDFGCKDTVVKEVLVEELFSLFIPSAFTPGEINPVFKPVIALQDLENYNFKIMNRWGEIIYNTSNLYEGWDGSKSGRFLPEGVYVYIVEAQHRNKIIKRIGNVTLLR